MVKFTILAGGYSAYISTYSFDSDSSTLSLVGQSPTGGNASWLSLHPANSSILYAVNEIDQAALQSFVVHEDGLLSDAISTVPTLGLSPTHNHPLKTGQVSVMNWSTGNGRVFPTSPDGLYFDNSSAPVITFPANQSHPHETVEHEDEILVPDLGADTIWRLVQESPDTPGTWKIQGSIPQPKGSGPRHIALADGFVYTLHETSNTLVSQVLPSEPNGTSDYIANISVIPTDLVEGAKMAAAEILIPAVSDTFCEPYIFTSNRNMGTQDPRGDPITIIRRGAKGELEVSGFVYTGLSIIRSMAFFGEDDKYLIAGGQQGDAGVVVYERTGDGGELTLVATNKEVPTRTSFVSIQEY
ncbi:putative isomerase YbhE [Fomitiporia mediterranea MF3/22]|uniref:putative isomerase YbhE n=1 Tax=Fomitiporia mediterranea (strain MF3/22) TaxID=694068 RepID=UPI00044097A3|nr:putative isomerase YbhE [Fomitiporia mediterranea MF3/22]EJD02391.1 putative isomerase YbhE [Fomitiporia mediterranea MF3/22]